MYKVCLILLHLILQLIVLIFFPLIDLFCLLGFKHAYADHILEIA